jgi:hypothetical protein
MEENPYQSTTADGQPPRRTPVWTAAAAGVAVLGNIVAALIPIPTLLAMPMGSHGRLLIETFYVFLVAVATLLVVIILAVVGLCKERRPVVAAIAICFALTPLFLSGWVMNQVAAARHIVLSS